MIISLWFYFNLINYTQSISMCKRFTDQNETMELNFEQLRSFCDLMKSFQLESNDEDVDSLPDFDLSDVQSRECFFLEIFEVKLFNELFRRRY